MVPIKYLLLVISLTHLFGCSPVGLYDWGEYEQSLHLRYIDNEAELAQSAIRNTIENSSTNSRVPPGVYAEYGFILYQARKYNDAINFFKKEQRQFPESSALMSKLIDRINQQKLSIYPVLNQGMSVEME